MPWNESTKMDEKLRFVSRFLDGEKIAPLCAEFGISRVTGHKIIERYKDSGLEAFSDRSRRPFRQANRLPFQVEQLIVKLKKEFPTWGAPKLRERLRTHYGEIALPAKSTVHAVLDRHGLVKKKRTRRHPKLTGTNLSDLKEPNALWCTDYKGEFMLGNRQYCYPLTVTDYASRFLICCEGLESTKEAQAITVFAGHDVGVRQVEDDVWLVSFMDYDFGYFDLESNKVQALDNPFGPKVLGV